MLASEGPQVVLGPGDLALVDDTPGESEPMLVPIMEPAAVISRTPDRGAAAGSSEHLFFEQCPGLAG